MPVTDNPYLRKLKSMLLTMQKDFHRGLQLSPSQIQDSPDCLEERTDILEEYVGK